MSVTEIIGAVISVVVAISVVLLFGWMIFELVRTSVTGRPNRFRAWATGIEARVARGPRVIKWPYFCAKWILATLVIASIVMKAIGEVQRGEPAAGVAFVVGLPLSFLIHFLDGLAKAGHRDGA